VNNIVQNAIQSSPSSAAINGGNDDDDDDQGNSMSFETFLDSAELERSMLKRFHPKRAIRSIRWTISDQFSIAIRL
jgi:hypothetical protein